MPPPLSQKVELFFGSLLETRGPRFVSASPARAFLTFSRGRPKRAVTFFSFCSFSSPFVARQDPLLLSVASAGF
jgi:hypothetical protein